MVIKSSMFIVDNDEEHLIPLRTSSKSFIHFLDKLLTLGDIMRRVIIIPWEDFEIKVPLFNDSVVRELPFLAVPLEM